MDARLAARKVTHAIQAPRLFPSMNGRLRVGMAIEAMTLTR